MASATSVVGNRGEDIATEWLRKNGYMIVARNWRDGHYELDIIAQRGFSLHIIEVKSRAKSSWERPEEAMNRDKMRSIMRGASRYLASHPTELEVQFDLIAIDFDTDGQAEVRYIPDAIQRGW
ncbi:MAG: YraN family protein [Rikenellaceae bacterium]